MCKHVSYLIGLPFSEMQNKKRQVHYTRNGSTAPLKPLILHYKYASLPYCVKVLLNIVMPIIMEICRLKL